MSGFASLEAFEAALGALPRPDADARAAAEARQAVLTKPAGSLGRLEEVAVFLAGWQGRERPRIERGRVAIFAGNHGVASRGVSAFPPAVTAEMVRNFRNGGAAINALAKAAGLELIIVPLDLDTPTADFTIEPAMTDAECLAAINAGAAVVDPELDLLVLGEMGIGNSTSAAALCAASFGGSAADWVGPGTGVHGVQLATKVAVVEAGLRCMAMRTRQSNVCGAWGAARSSPWPVRWSRQGWSGCRCFSTASSAARRSRRWQPRHLAWWTTASQDIARQSRATGACWSIWGSSRF